VFSRRGISFNQDDYVMGKISETRKLVKWGSSKTLIMSLPRNWTKKNNLTEADEVQVSENPDGSLLILPLQFKVEGEPMEAEIKVDQYPETKMLANVIQTKFLDGYDQLHLTSKTTFTETQVKEIAEIVSELMGFEILTRTFNEIAVKDIMAIKDSSLDELVKLVSNSVVELMTSFIKALIPVNYSILEPIIGIKKNIFKYYLRIHRQLRKALMQPSLLAKMNITTQDAVDFAFFIVDLNEIATNIASMANAVIKFQPKEVVERTLEILHPVSERLKDAISAFLFRNIKGLSIFSQIDELKGLKREIENDIDSITYEEPHIESQIILDNTEKIMDYIFSIAQAALRRTI